MMKFKWLVTVFFLFSQFAFAQSIENDKKEIETLVRKLYSYTGDQFEGGKLNGNFEPKKLCDFYINFFVKDLIKKPKNYAGCEVDLNRYPSLGSEDLGGPYAIRPLPKPQLGVSVIDGDKAYIETFVKKSKLIIQASKTVYFLTKNSNGWRIENALIFEEWPKPESKTDCYGYFIYTPVSSYQKKAFPTACNI